LKKLENLRRNLDGLHRVAEQGRILREGTRVVLIGQPNVGKSSLLNRLAEDEVAIVTDVPGTTRDPLRHELALEGVPVHVIDTAGLRKAQDQVEAIGIERAWREVRQADMALLVIDVTQGIAAADREILSQLPVEIKKLFIFNKIDITGDKCGETPAGRQTEIRLSAKTGEGVALLRAAILREAGYHPAGEVQFMARARHLHALADAESALSRASGQSVMAIELFAEELRLAQHALGTITGAVSPDDLLGEIFSRFCIGK
jgi:tRNA modification GTPase